MLNGSEIFAIPNPVQYFHCVTQSDFNRVLAAELCLSGATLSLARRAMVPGHLLHSGLTCPLSANTWHRKSRQPLVPAATISHHFMRQQQHTCSTVGGSPFECGVGRQHHKTQHFHSRNQHPTSRVTIPRRAWVQLNCLRTGVGRVCSILYKWGVASCATCECGAEEQTIDHVVLQCPIHRPPMDCMA